MHEYFPAAGFRTKNSLCVGLLTDSGYRNQWTRIIRRDGKPVKPAPRRIPDAESVFRFACRGTQQGRFFRSADLRRNPLEQEDGEQNAQIIVLPDISSWKKQGEATLDERDGVATISTKNSDDGVIIPFAARPPSCTQCVWSIVRLSRWQLRFGM